jgi:hypothetical protein
MKEKSKAPKSVFFKQLTFKRPEGVQDKIAEFTDKHGQDAYVLTTWHTVIPGLRYNCKLDARGHVQKSKKVLYTLLHCRLWADELNVVEQEKTVEVHLDGKPVDALTFGLGHTADVEGRVEDLREYFKQKTFQLSSRKDIDTFLEVFEESCNRVYKTLCRDMKKGSKTGNTKIRLN